MSLSLSFTSVYVECNLIGWLGGLILQQLMLGESIVDCIYGRVVMTMYRELLLLYYLGVRSNIDPVLISSTE